MLSRPLQASLLEPFVVCGLNLLVFLRVDQHA
jgi:hypothetical protein